jgi:hypothetical protein
VALAAAVVATGHPIYWRPRFPTLVLPPFLALTAMACDILPARLLRWSAVAALAGVMLAGTYMQRDARLKTDWRRFARVWETQPSPAKSAFFPAILSVGVDRYTIAPVVSATRDEIEASLPALEGSEIWVCADIFRGLRDPAYYNWLMGLGSVRRVEAPTSLWLQAVRVGGTTPWAAYADRLNRCFAPIDIAGTIEGFEEPARFYRLELTRPEARPFRWSKPKAWFALTDNDDVSTVVLNVQLPPPAPDGYRPMLRVYAERGGDVSAVAGASPRFRLDDYRAGAFQIPIAVPQGRDRLWIAWTINGVNLARAGVAGDSRDLGIRINWIATLGARD